jgi:hypothetical protein
MMPQLIMKLRRSRSTKAVFADRVVGAADASRVIDYTNLDLPFLAVTFLSDDAEGQQPGSNDYRQRITQSWGVIVALSATFDVRGQEATQTMETIKPAIFRAIYNWAPDKNHGVLSYGGTRLLQVSRAATFWLMTFNTFEWVCGDDGELEEQFEPLPDFLGMNVNVDWMQPFDPGLPPSEEYDPRRGPPPWRYGPEGRIESTFTIDLPQTRKIEKEPSE